MTNLEVDEVVSYAMRSLERAQASAANAKSPFEIHAAMVQLQTAQKNLKAAMNRLSSEINEKIG